MKNLVSLDRLRTDPIASGLIVAFLTFVGGQFASFVYSLFNNSFSLETAWNTSTSYLHAKIELWWLLVFLLFAGAIFFLLRWHYRRRSKDPYRSVNVKEKIGDFKAGELFNLLLSTNLDIPKRFAASGVTQMNLLQLFLLYQRYFNMGVSWNHPGEDGHFMYYKLGPELMSLGLTEKVRQKVKFALSETETEESIQTSLNGYKLCAFAQRVKLYSEIYPEHEKSSTKKAN